MPIWLSLLLNLLVWIAKNFSEAKDLVQAIGDVVAVKHPDHAPKVRDFLGAVLPTDTEEAKIDADIEATKNEIEANETYGIDAK